MGPLMDENLPLTMKEIEEAKYWSAFRREAAKDIFCAIISRMPGANPEHITMAIEMADELAKQLKEKEK